MNWISRFLNAIFAPFRKVFGWIARLTPGLRNLSITSVPVRIALVTFFMLLMFSLIWSIRVNILLEKDQNVLRSIPQIILVIVLTFVVPVCVYFAVKLLSEGDVSEYEDIDTAWKKGVEAIEQFGIDLQYTPLFLVIGTPNAQNADSLHDAAMLSLEFAQVPGGNGPIQWFANKEAIFLHLTDCCCLSKLAIPNAGEPPLLNSPNQFMQTLQLDPSDPGQEQAALRTMVADTDAAVSGARTGADAGPDLGGAMHTLQPGNMMLPGRSIDPHEISKFDRGETTISTQELAEYAARLKYVVQLIKKARHPVCPINGTLSVLPFSMIESAPDQAQLAWRRDLKVISDSTQMRFPLTILISEMEKEHGFMELVRRIGLDASKQRRFGKGFGSGETAIWTPPNESRLRALAQLACRAFQDNIFYLFARRDAFQKTGNGKLYSLLYQVRRKFSEQLESVMVNAISDTNIMLTGCYFAATGNTEDQQAFVKNVVSDRLIGNQANISWDESAASENRKFQSYSNILAIVGFVSLVLLIVMIFISMTDWAVSIRNALFFNS